LGKPSKPTLALDPRRMNYQYQNNQIYLAWGSDFWDSQPIEPDINYSELQVSRDSVYYTTNYSGTDRFITESSFNYDSTGNSSVQFRARVRDSQDKWSIWSNPISIKINDQSIINSINDIVTTYNVSQNFPNPFNPSTKIQFQIPNDSFVNLIVYNILGSEVATIVNEEKTAGSYEVEFIASDLASGIYFYTLEAGSYVETKKMILLK
jgi:hypothetical protein